MAANGVKFEAPQADCKVLANIGNNHNGDPDLAGHLVDVASAAGCSGVVLPHRRLEGGYTNETLLQPVVDQSHRPITRGEVLKALELSSGSVAQLRQRCQGRLSFVGAPYDLEAFSDFEANQPDAYQVDPPVLGHTPLLKAIAATGRPVFLVAGMCTDDDIAAAVQLLEGQPLTLLHSVYASEVSLDATALWYLPYLQKTFGLPVGYLGREPGIHASVAAFAMGARTIEKFFTSDRYLPGPFHATSMDREELRELVTCLNQIDRSLDGSPPRLLLEPEVGSSSDPQACLVAAHDLSAGGTLGETMLSVKLAPDGIHPRMIDRLLGRRLAYDVPADSPLTFGVLEE